MLTKTIIAASALLSVAAAIPLQQLNKRDVVYETKTHWDVTTIDVTTTIWLEPGETAPAGAETTHLGHHHHHKGKTTSHITSTVTVQPASASSPPEQSSPYVAPTTSTLAPVPTTSVETTTPVATSSAKPSATSQPTSGGGGYPGNGITGAAAAGTEYTGDFTWFADGLGACGYTSTPSDHIVAISEDLFDQYTPASGNPNDNPLCGLMVTLTGVDGNAYPAKIVDRCTGCALSDLDLSEDFFNTVTSNGNGRVSGMHWVFD